MRLLRFVSGSLIALVLVAGFASGSFARDRHDRHDRHDHDRGRSYVRVYNAPRYYAPPPRYVVVPRPYYAPPPVVYYSGYEPYYYQPAPREGFSFSYVFGR